MTTENQTETTSTEEVKTETTQETKAPEVTVSPTEANARQAGWVSKDEWVAQGKNPDDWRTAREYQERGELFEEIHKLKENNKKTSAAFKALVEHHKKVRESAVKEAIDKLKQEKKDALANHEIERVYALDEEIERVRESKQDIPEIEVPDVEVGPTPFFKSWHKRNNWYSLQGENEVSIVADSIGAKFRKDNPGATEQELLEHVESRIARRFPEVFENQNSSRKPEVNSSSAATQASTNSIKLSEEEERVCKMLIDQGVMTRKQYLDEIKALRGAA